MALHSGGNPLPTPSRPHLSESPLAAEGLGVGQEDVPQHERRGSRGHVPSHQLQVHPRWSGSPEGRQGDIGVLSGEELRALSGAWHEGNLSQGQESGPTEINKSSAPCFPFTLGGFPKTAKRVSYYQGFPGLLSKHSSP